MVPCACRRELENPASLDITGLSRFDFDLAKSGHNNAFDSFPGCVALSTYVPGNLPPLEEGAAKLKTPVLQCHGEADEVVPFQRGQQTYEILKKFVEEVKFKVSRREGIILVVIS